MKKEIMTLSLTIVMALGICGEVSDTERGKVVGAVKD